MWETYGLALFNFTASLISVKFITCTAPQIRNFKFRSKGKNSTVQLKLTGEIFAKEINVLFFVFLRTVYPFCSYSIPLNEDIV